MALAQAILVSLLEQPQTGYDLARGFDTAIGFFWQASHQQIYGELKKLETQGAVSSKAVPQSGRPNKNVYALTETGALALEAWMAEPASRPQIAKDDLLIRTFALGRVRAPTMATQIQERRTRHQERLALYQQIETKRYTFDDGTVPDHLVGKYLCLRGGLKHEAMWIEWCDEALALIG